VDIERFIVDHTGSFRSLHGVEYLVDRLAHPAVVQGDRDREVIPPFQQLVNVVLAVEAPVEHVVEVLDLDLEYIEGLEQVVHCLDIGDVAGGAVVVDRDPALLAEEHGKVQLWQPLPVAIVAKTDVFVQLAVGRDTRDVVAAELILEDLFHPCRH